MKKIIIVLFLFIYGLVSAQHTRQGLLQPSCADYNLRGNPLKVTAIQKYEQGNDVNFQEIFIFDTTGKLTQYRKRGFGGERFTDYPLTRLDPQLHYDFDYDGDILRAIEFDMKKRLVSSTHYIYGRGGNLMQTVRYSYSNADSGAVIERQVTIYDKHERPVTISTYTADELLLVAIKLKYDRRGNNTLRRTTYYDEESTTVTSERRKYTYDTHSNWTRCQYLLDDKPIYTIERTIEY